MKLYLAVLALLVAAAPAAAQDWAIVPDPTLTPGAVRTTDVADICSTPTSGLRHWSRERDDRILSEYGLPTGPHPSVEIDHLIPLCLGGADDDKNLWPEPRRSIEKEWPAELKDDLEHRLCETVCAGELDAREAQRLIAEDWTAAYRQFFRQRASNLSLTNPKQHPI
jgi:hypothetical protein